MDQKLVRGIALAAIHGDVEDVVPCVIGLLNREIRDKRGGRKEGGELLTNLPNWINHILTIRRWMVNIERESEPKWKGS